MRSVILGFSSLLLVSACMEATSPKSVVPTKSAAVSVSAAPVDHDPVVIAFKAKHAEFGHAKAGIWKDPNGCFHYVGDDGTEGYLSQLLDPSGNPICEK